MNRWSRNTYNWAYRFLCLRDGEHCIICKVRPRPNTMLEIHHIDGDITNTNPENLCLLCKRHNCGMRNMKPAEQKRIICKYSLQNEREREIGLAIPATQFTKETIDYQSGSTEMQANSLFETKYRKWIIDNVIIKGEFLKEDAINSGAEEVGCSPITTRRYLQKLTSSSGVFYETTNGFGQVVIRLNQTKKTLAAEIRDIKRT